MVESNQYLYENTEKVVTNLYGLVWFGMVGFYGISTFVGSLMPNPFLFKESGPFQAIQFNISLSKIFLFQAVQLSQIVLIQTIHFSIRIDISIVFVCTQLNVKTVLFQTI